MTDPRYYIPLAKAAEGAGYHAMTIPDSIAYPLDEMLKQFRDYFTCTCSYQMALAIAMQPDEIGVYGVNMAMDTEYAQQRPSCEYWMKPGVGGSATRNVPSALSVCCPALRHVPTMSCDCMYPSHFRQPSRERGA